MTKKPKGKGCAVIFLPPFTVHADATASPPVKIKWGQGLFRIYWPHVNEGGSSPTIRQADLLNIPYLAGVAGLRSTPPTIGVRMEPNWNRPSILADALRIDCYPEAAVDECRIVGRRFYSLLRFFTRQWWITRDRRFEEPVCRNWITVDSRGAPGRTVQLTGEQRVHGRFGYEGLLNADLFGEVCAGIEANTVVPFYWDLLLDANYFHAVDDTRMTVLSAAMACENVLVELVDVKPRNRLKEGMVYAARFDASSLEKNLREHLRKVGCPSFAEAHPRAVSVLAQAWRARHTHAHGRRGGPPLAKDATNESEGGSRILIVRAVLTLFDWIGISGIPMETLLKEGTS